MALNEEMERRLIYAKYLFLHGQEHARDDTEVGRMIAIHNFDNAVELILKCIATKYDIQSEKKIVLDFKSLWDVINNNENYKKEINDNLPFKNEMFGLHNLRNGVQHHGNVPSYEDTIRRMKEAEDFLKEVIKMVFETDFYELSLAFLIEDEEIKSLIAEAEKKLGENDYENSIILSSTAFYKAGIREKKKIAKLFTRTPHIQFNNELDLQDIGVDIHDFGKFISITPKLIEFSEILEKEDLSRIDREWRIGDKLKTKDSAQYCFNFALKYILKWQSFWRNEEV